MTAQIAALAFFAGLLAGHYLRDLIDLARRRCARRQPREGRMKIVTAQRVQWIALGLAVVLLLVEGLLLIRTREENADYIKCKAAWDQQEAASSKAVRDAAQEVSAAMDGVIFAVAAKDAEKFKASIANYVQIRKAQDATREKNPPPAPPEDVCGKPGGS